MKNVIIAGVSRAGKSTLAKKIAKDYQMSYIPFDSIVSTLEELYPQTGISHQDENIEMSKSIAVFLKGFMKHLEYEDRITSYNVCYTKLLRKSRFMQLLLKTRKICIWFLTAMKRYMLTAKKRIKRGYTRNNFV